MTQIVIHLEPGPDGQPTGRTVKVPYSVVYDLRDGQISALRIYFPMSLLVEQLTS